MPAMNTWSASPWTWGGRRAPTSATVWLFLAAAVWWAYSQRSAPDHVRRTTVELLVAVVAQGAVGYYQYFAGVPAVLVGIHVATATMVWVLTLRTVLRATDQRWAPA